MGRTWVHDDQSYIPRRLGNHWLRRRTNDADRRRAWCGRRWARSNDVANSSHFSVSESPFLQSERQQTASKIAVTTYEENT